MMMNERFGKIEVIVIVFVIGILGQVLCTGSSQGCNCRFSQQFSSAKGFSDPVQVDQYIRCVMQYEGRFAQIAYNNITGLTYDGHEIDWDTGLLVQPLHFWSAPSKGFFFFFFFILFYFILFYFILFYFILFYFILFYFILFYFILFYFILFYFILFYFILFY